MSIPQILISALIAVESNGRDAAIGDGGAAVGCLQIHEIVIRDVNRMNLGKRFDYADRLDRKKSIEICEIYLGFYATEKRLGRLPTIEDMARIWNGGPDGWRERATVKYWDKVRREVGLLAGKPFRSDDSFEGVILDTPASQVNLTGLAGISALRPPDPKHPTAEERAAWDAYAAALLTGIKVSAADCARIADDMIAERRKRFPVT